MDTYDQNLKRLISHTFLNTTTGCLEWTGALDRDGYGRTSIDGETMSSHRAAWLMKHGWLPEGNKQVISHKCGNRLCCNVKHLACISQGENLRWSHAAGRFRNRKPVVRISDALVASMRRASAAGDSVRAISRLAGTSLGHTADIVASRVRVAA